jgi:hypothetical protein
MNLILWIVQGLLAFAFIAVGFQARGSPFISTKPQYAPMCAVAPPDSRPRMTYFLAKSLVLNRHGRIAIDAGLAQHFQC